MLQFICDKCNTATGDYQTSTNSRETIPKRWLTIKGAQIENEIHNPALIYSGGQNLHFCSQMCFVNYFFKTVPPEPTSPNTEPQAQH